MTAGALDPLSCPLDGIRLIEASAGTGKTWTICALVLRLLVERRLTVAQILVVTFTTAATAELRQRIRARIAELRAHLRGGPAGDAVIAGVALAGRRLWEAGALDAHLDHALQSFDEAAVFTIHGFCRRALADAPFTARVAPTLELLEDDGELRRAAVHDFWRRRVAAGDPALAAHLLARKDTPERFDQLLRRHLGKPLAQLVWPAAIDAPAADDGAALAAAHRAAQALWQGGRDGVVAQVRQAAVAALWTNVYKPAAIDQARDAWDHILADARAVRLDADDAKAALFGAARLGRHTKQKQRTPEHPFFDAAQRLLEQRAARRLALDLARLRLLRELIEDGARRLRHTKRERRVVAFDDLLYNLWLRVAGEPMPGFAQALRARYPAALIDEFQDTDPLQFAIFRGLHAAAPEAPLFLVGDPKQAIYRFRNADLHAYLAARGIARSRHALPDNQRSDARLIDAVNALFAANSAAFMLPGLDFAPAHFGTKLRTAWTDRSAPAAPLTLWRLPRGADGAPLHKAEAGRRAVAATAAEIARLLGAAAAGDVRIGARPLAAGDIAVLVRTHAQGRAVAQALAALGVGSVEHAQASVFASVDAQELECVLAAVLEPAREPALRAALATTLLGHDAAAVAALADAAAADGAALLAAVQRLAAYRDTWRSRGVAVMLRQWMAGEQVAGRLLARADGERRMTDLLHLAEALHHAALDHPAPDAQLRWLQAERRAARSDDAALLRLESDRNLVQIVTVHRSKGLEYAVVFCPLLWDGGGRHDRAVDGIAVHREDGALTIDFRAGAEPGFDDRPIRERIALEDAAERLRLLYVALTRAVHRCTLVVGPYTTGGATRPPSANQSGRALLNWLVAGGGVAPADWLHGEREPAVADAAWDALAAAHPQAIGSTPLPQGGAAPLASAAVPPAAIVARPPPASIAAGWRIGSFSAMLHGAVSERAAVDHDLRAAVAPVDTESAIDADDILRFPRGAAAGECLHAVFERVDFGDPAQWPAAVDAVLRLHGPALGGGAEAPAQNARRLLRMLHDVLPRPLTVGTASPLVLARVPRGRRIAELEFHLPVDRLEPGALDRVLARLGLPVPRLGFNGLSGFVKGFIDLVFEHDGRVFVLDWKSNHLGDAAADYAGPPLAVAMGAHGYHLQSLLYSVAVRRWLRRHGDAAPAFGGAVYLFVRGVRAGWVTPSGAPCGLHFQLPQHDALDAVDALLDGGAGT